MPVDSNDFCVHLPNGVNFYVGRTAFTAALRKDLLHISGRVLCVNTKIFSTEGGRGRKIEHKLQKRLKHFCI
jgi:hypothetical protein